jgi:glycosyltransferase involved in cell wall biosynthesis
MSQNNNILNDKPLFTIITATYNADKFLESTIESIKSQTFKSFEWIIIDGRSTDKTTDIINNNISIFDLYISEDDDGIYDAWNKGIAHSNGEWITFIGAGDQLKSDALEKYSKLILRCDKKSGYNFISSKAAVVDVNEKNQKIIGKKFDASEFIKFMSISHVGSMHHRSLFRKFGLYSKKFKLSSDYEFLLRCKDSIEPLFLNEITVKMLSGGMSNSYKSIYETYIIQKKYHSWYLVRFYYFMSAIKLSIRKFLKIH